MAKPGSQGRAFLFLNKTQPGKLAGYGLLDFAFIDARLPPDVLPVFGGPPKENGALL
jgi:hypothetical protein